MSDPPRVASRNVADFLSDAWFLAVNEKLASRWQGGTAQAAHSSKQAITLPSSSAPFLIAIELSAEPNQRASSAADADSPPNREPSSPTTWHLRIDDRGARVAPGIPEGTTPTLTIFTDARTGSELAANTTNAQRAIDSGRLRVRGDLNALATMTAVFTQLSTIPSAPTDL